MRPAHRDACRAAGSPRAALRRRSRDRSRRSRSARGQSLV